MRQPGDLMSPDVTNETQDGIYIWIPTCLDGRFDAEYVAAWLEMNGVDKDSVSRDRDIYISNGRVYLSQLTRNESIHVGPGGRLALCNASYEITVPFGSEIA